MNNSFIPVQKSQIKSFTLIEIIIVIIIVGILAAVGMTQYSKTVEKGRQTEVKIAVGTFRDLVHAYYLDNGTRNGMTNGDLNMGTSLDQLPTACRSSHYFSYSLDNISGGDPQTLLNAYRCTSGGKTPNVSTGYAIQFFYYPDSGTQFWDCNSSYSYTPNMKSCP